MSGVQACATVAVDLSCSEWVTVHPYLLPPLSSADAGELSTLIVGAWIVAVCGRWLVDRFFRR